MVGIPWVLYVAVVCSVLPVLAGLRAQRTNPLWWALLVGATANLLSLGLARAQLGTNFLSYISPPIETALLAWAIVRWPAMRGERGAAVGFGLLIAMATLYALISEFPTPKMGTVVGPMAAWGLLAMLSIAVRAQWGMADGRTILVVWGLALYLVPVAILQPFFYQPIGIALYQIVQGMQSLAYLVFTVAFLVPRREPERLRVA